MRSFLAYSYSIGNYRWVLSSRFKDAPLRQMLDSLPRLDVIEGNSPQNTAYYALGTISGNEEPSPCFAVVPSDSESLESLVPVFREAFLEAVPLAVITIGDLDSDDLPFGGFIQTFRLDDANGIEGWDLQRPVHIHMSSEMAETAESMLNRDHDFEPETPAIAYPRPNLGELARTIRFNYVDGIVLMTGWLPFADLEAATWLARELNVPVIADATSGLREELNHLCIRDAETVIRANPPGSVIRLGRVPSSPVWTMLRDMPGIKVFSLSRDLEPSFAHDTLIRGGLDPIIEALGEIHAVGDPCGIMPQSRKRQGKIEELLLSHTESAQALLKGVSEFACIADNIFLDGPGLLNAWNEVSQWRTTAGNITTHLSGNETGRLATFLGNSHNSEESWAILDGISDGQELDELDAAGAKGVIVCINMTPESQGNRIDLEECARSRNIAYARIESSFDLDLLESSRVNEITIFEIIPDREQTDDFNRALTIS